MPLDESSDEGRLSPPRFTLRGALAVYSVLGVIVSVPLVGLGFTLTAGILLVLFVLQFPLLLLFGASSMTKQTAPDYEEWDRWREDRRAGS